MSKFRWLPLFLGCCGVLSGPFVAALRAGDSSPSAGGYNRNGGQPLNLARTNLGARLEGRAPAGPINAAEASAALLHDDDPLGYPLAEGATSLIVTLPKIEVLNRFNFLNLTAAGSVAISVSSAQQPPDGKNWRRIQEPLPFADADVTTCELGSVEARYVKIDFQVEKPGRVDTFGLFGLPTLNAQSKLPSLVGKGNEADTRLLLFNYAVSSSQAGVVMVSPGEDINRAQAIADGDVGSNFTFNAMDAQPTAVIDLGETRTLNRVSASFKAGPGHLDIYLLPDPQRQPTERGGSQKLKVRTIQEIVASDFPAGRQPVLSTETGKQTGLTRVGANVNTQSGRYLVMVFHPAGGAVSVASAAVVAQDFKDAKDFKDVHDGKDGVATAEPAPFVGGTPLVVSEITAFGNVPPGAYAQHPTPNLPGFVPPGGSELAPPPGSTGTTPNLPPILPPSQGGNAVSPF